MPIDRSARITIVGGGAAGLATAHYLRKAGFERLTVLEQRRDVGGKCCTIEHRGRTYELGAGIHTNSYTTVSDIMRDVGVESQPVYSSMYVDFEGGRWRKTPIFVQPRQLLPLGLSGLWLTAYLRKHRRIFEPGFAGVDPQLATPFATWASRRHMAALTEALSVVHTGFGYGYFHEVAAAYVLKYLTVFRLPREFLDIGWGGLWRKVAAPLDVRFDAAPRAIRRGATVRVDTPAGAHECDYLVLACPLDEALGYLDATDDETDLFSRIRYYDYHVFAGITENVPDARYAFVPSAPPGRTMFWYRRFLDTDLCTFYSLGKSSRGMTETVDHEQIRRAIEDDLARIGGRITGYRAERVWKYFPHVSPADIADGYYDRLEALQGRNRTFLTGELLNFSTVETVAAYSRALVERYFA